MITFRKPMAAFAGACLLASSALADEATELRFAVQTPPQLHYNKELFVPWAEKVAADSQGTLSIKMFFAGALGKEGQLIDVVESGAADIALDLPSYYSGRFNLTDVASLPMLVDDGANSSKALWALYEKGLFGTEFDGLKVLAIATPPAATILTTDKQIRQPSDLAGMKLAAGGKVKGEIAMAVDAAPVEVKVADLYQALSRSLVDGAITYYTAFAPFKLHEIGKHALDVPLGGSMMLVFMSQDRFDSLPPQAQKAIEMNFGAQLSADFGAVWDRAQTAGRQMLLEAGGEIIEPTEEQTAEWQTVFSPLLETWANSLEGGPEALDALRAELATNVN